MLRVARNCIQAAIDSVDPRAAVASAFRLDESGSLSCAGTPIRAGQRVVVVGGGKASVPMVQGVEDALRRAEGIEVAGHIVTKDGHTAGQSLPAWCGVTEASHPVPNSEGVRGTKRVLELAAAAAADDLVIALISGGGSSLLTCPVGDEAGVGLKAIQETTAALLGSGATIHDMNRVRACLDTVKGGGLARAVWPATLVTLVLSDVIGDDLRVIASGPTILPRTSSASDGASSPTDSRHAEGGAFATSPGAQALDVLKRFLLAPPAIPQAVIDHLTTMKPVAGAVAGPVATHSAGGGGGGYGAVQVVANNSIAAEAFTAACPELDATVLTLAAEGDAADVGRLLVRIARHKAEASKRLEASTTASAEAAATATEGVVASQAAGGGGIVVLMAGETTVRLPPSGCGRGGRNQHMALAAALELEAWEADAKDRAGGGGEAELAQHAVFVAVGTDGTDGPTDAAGGIVTSRSAAAARAAGCDVRRCLEACDAYSALEAVGVVTMGEGEGALPANGGLLKTGPTGTNVMDIYAVFVPF